MDAVRSEQQRLAREEKAAIGRKKQREEDKLRILRQADQKGIRLPLTSGTWRGVRAVVYGDDDDEEELSEESERERKEGERTRRLGPETRSETRKRQWKSYRSSETRKQRNEWSSDEGEEDEEGEKKDKKKDELEDEDEEEDKGPIRSEEKMFEVDFAKLSPEKREVRRTKRLIRGLEQEVMGVSVSLCCLSTS